MGHAGRERPVGVRGLGEGLRVGGIHLGLFAALEGLLGLLLIGELRDRAGVEGLVALDVNGEGSEGLLGGLVRGCLGQAVGVVVFEGSREGFPRAGTLVCVGFPRALGRQRPVGLAGLRPNAPAPRQIPPVLGIRCTILCKELPNGC